MKKFSTLTIFAVALKQFVVGTAWQIQTLSRDKAWPIISEEFLFTFLKRLNCGSLQQCGQYHSLGFGVEIAKQDR